MTLDPNTGDMISVEHIQSLSQIQNTRGDLFESSDGTLFTGGGWCLYKPAYYSTDGGETWQTADSGPVHPPNSVYSFVEFNRDVYAGTGYEPYPGQVYRWLGDGNWELVLDIGTIRNIVDAMVVYDNQLFVGSDPYGDSGAACASTIPVLVSSDGNTFNPTAGIPGCCGVRNLLVAGNQLLALVADRNTGQQYTYRWNDISETWEELAAYNLEYSPAGMTSHNGVIYTCGQAPSDASAGIYQSVDQGVTWQQIAVLENPDASSMTIHDDTLYIGTWHDANNKAYIYRKSLFGETLITSCDNDGKEKNQFEPGESVYVKGNGLEADTIYRIWIQSDPVSEGDLLTVTEDPSGFQEVITTNANGDFSPEPIWAIPSHAPPTYDKFDIVVDKLNDGGNTGKYNAASDGLDSATVVGFVAPVPEFPTMAIPVVTILGLLFLISRRRRK